MSSQVQNTLSPLGLCKALDTRGAADIVALDVRGISGYTDTVVIASGRSSANVKALAEAAQEYGKLAGQPAVGVEGEDAAEWVLVDLAEIVVHLFTPEARAYYDIENLWIDAPKIDLALVPPATNI